MTEQKLSILWHSVSPFIRSGYGKATNYITQGLTKAGYKVIISAYYGVEPGGVLNYNGVPVLSSKEGPFGVHSAAKFAKQYGVDVGLLFTDWWAFCFQEDTEILTSEGWKTYSKIKDDEIIATFNEKTNQIEYQKIIEKRRFENYLNELYQFKSKQLDLILTEDHNIIFKNFSKGKIQNYWRKAPIQTFNSTTQHLIPVSGEAKSNISLGLSKELAWLLGFILAEGSFPKHSKNKRRLFIYQSIKNEHINQKLRQILNLLNISFHEVQTGPGEIYGYKTQPTIQFQIRAEGTKRLIKYFESYKPKLLTKEFLFCSQEEFESILEGWTDGDGWNEACKSSFQIKTVSKEHVDFLQTFCILHGYRCTYKFRKDGKYDVTISRRKYATFSGKHIRKLNEKIKFPVWGVSVPNGTVIVRRNGRHCIVGNSDFPRLLPNATLYGPMDHTGYPEEILNFTRMYYKIISLCKWQQENLKKVGIESECIYHGVDLNYFKPMDKDQCRGAFGIPKDKFVFGTVAANSDKEDRKAHGRMMKAMRYFLDSNPDVKESEILWLYHSVPNDPRGMPLSSICHKFRLDNVIKFMDPNIADTMISEEQLAALMNCFDVHLLTSKREGFGMPTLETQACGIPNIGHDFSSMTELIKGHGWLCKSLGYDLNLETTPINAETASPDVYSIADCIKDAYFDEKKRLGYGEKSREFALKYSWDDLIRYRWVPLLETIQEDLKHLPGRNIFGISSRKDEIFKSKFKEATK
jgi:glycosyltransferase involved in cell wall biosynthesis